jgi:DNA-binding response OmpR family regulator
MGNPRVLIVDDEPIVVDVVERYLHRDGYEVAVAADGEAAVAAARDYEPDLIVLDLMLPKLDGLEVFRQVRVHSAVPVIILTAKGEETDRVVGLEMGADDYIAKPFSPRELVARVKAVLRRASVPISLDSSRQALKVGDMVINPSSRQLTARGAPVELTAKEFDLIWFLAKNVGQVFSRSQLLNQVWDYQYFGDASTVTVHIRRLRSKVEADPMRPRHIKTVWGVGYKFEV